MIKQKTGVSDRVSIGIERADEETQLKEDNERLHKDNQSLIQSCARWSEQVMHYKERVEILKEQIRKLKGDGAKGTCHDKSKQLRSQDGKQC